MLKSFYLNLRSTVLSKPGENPGGEKWLCENLAGWEGFIEKFSYKTNWTQFLEIKRNLLGKDITGKTREDSNHVNTEFPIKSIQSVIYYICE